MPGTRRPAPATIRQPADTTGFVHLPDGTWIEALNGVRNAPPYNWPKEIPNSPIVGKEFDTLGNWWYVHADGSKSTTRMADDPQRGGKQAVTTIANPMKPLPIRNEELPGPRQTGK